MIDVVSSVLQLIESDIEECLCLPRMYGKKSKRSHDEMLSMIRTGATWQAMTVK
jgi:hypothetical protein